MDENDEIMNMVLALQDRVSQLSSTVSDIRRNAMQTSVESQTSSMHNSSRPTQLASVSTGCFATGILDKPTMDSIQNNQAETQEVIRNLTRRVLDLERRLKDVETKRVRKVKDEYCQTINIVAVEDGVNQTDDNA